MRRNLRPDVLTIAALLSIGGILGLVHAQEKPTHQTIAGDLEPLRTAFDAHPEDVRAILLASPT